MMAAAAAAAVHHELSEMGFGGGVDVPTVRTGYVQGAHTSIGRVGLGADQTTLVGGILLIDRAKSVAVA